MNTCQRCGLVIADSAMGTTTPQCKCHWRSQEKIVLFRGINDTKEEFLRRELAEYKQRAEAAEAKLRELEMQEPVATLNLSGNTISFGVSSPPAQLRELFGISHLPIMDTKIIQLYAKPFPAPKQEEK